MKIEKQTRDYLREIGKRGGRVSQRELTKQQARHMVFVRELKRASLAAGKPWPPVNARLKKLLKVPAGYGRPTPLPPYERPVSMREYLTRVT